MEVKSNNIFESPDTWSIARGTLDNRPIFVRYRDALVKAEGKEDYPFQIGVAIPLLSPTQEGLTTDEESKRLFDIEDKLEDSFADGEQAIHVMTITYNGMREFVLYAKEWEPAKFEQFVKNIEDQSESKYQLQFMMQEDKQWETFKNYTQML